MERNSCENNMYKKISRGDHVKTSRKLPVCGFSLSLSQRNLICLSLKNNRTLWNYSLHNYVILSSYGFLSIFFIKYIFMQIV